MKSLVMPAPGELELVERPEPEMQPGCAKIRMEYCGICGSDLTAYKGVNPTVRYPIDGIGHEGIGVIEEIGENDRGLKVGDRVCTIGGIYGTITNIRDENTITLAVGPQDVPVVFARWAIRNVEEITVENDTEVLA